LLVRIQRDEPAAWERFVDLYGPLIFVWCRRHGLQAADAADIAQDVMTSVAGSIHSFQPTKPSGTLRAWLWKIARNKLNDYHRRRPRSPGAPGGTSFMRHLGQLPEDWSDDSSPENRGETAQLIRRCLELIRHDFQPVTWEAFWRATILEHDTASIAQELGISANAVRQYKSRVLRRLRRELGDQLE
jgi:RNA polymerase sigma-70 factor (ECF subfamily)